MKTVAIIQARMASVRLPGKALEVIAGRPILGWVIHRTMQIEGIDSMVVATSTRAVDEPIVDYCHRIAMRVIRGDAEDVLARFVLAAKTTEATHILRITADCPLLCPELNGEMLTQLHQHERDYVSYSTRSVGLVQEAFTTEALLKADAGAQTMLEREHVVPYIIRTSRHLFLKPPFDLGSGRWCVDTQSDLELLRRLAARTPDLFDRPARELVSA